MNNIHIPPIVKNLLIINILFFVATLVFNANNSYPFVEWFAVYFYASPDFKIWQVFSYMFMHSPVNYFHIIFNMFALYSFGSILENKWGGKKFLFFYFITGLGALALQWAVQSFEVYQSVGHIITDITNYIPKSREQAELLSSIYYGPMLGASGAVFGLLVAFGMLYPNAELYIMFIPVPVKAKYIMPFYILLELFLGVKQFEGDSVAHYAHLGGALIGFILVKIWKDKNTNFYTYYE
ncbi:rhomboid family intramembrane serine protease [Pedobacter agri]|uniref:rhomboid family intramembrane serine protease n=1 Tax=Pedobacter agri TaxID=454586 RepID=UPI0012114EC7|nr:rhomboid family intramembrane serine protease [Pedobacter agri]RZK18367.1 MAG: rhomboid family intramembrane serine protease [Pedobacter sp.]